VYGRGEQGIQRFPELGCSLECALRIGRMHVVSQPFRLGAGQDAGFLAKREETIIRSQQLQWPRGIKALIERVGEIERDVAGQELERLREVY